MDGKGSDMEVKKLKNYINGQWVESKTKQMAGGEEIRRRTR